MVSVWMRTLAVNELMDLLFAYVDVSKPEKSRKRQLLMEKLVINNFIFKVSMQVPIRGLKF